MKNIRKFETTADMENAVLEEVSVNYNVETNGVLSMPLKPNIKNYMRFVAVEDSQINLSSINMSTGEADTSVDLKHSKDGLTWTQYDFNPIPLAAGETLYLKGNNENGLSKVGSVCTFGDVMGGDNGSTGKFECHGNIMSLLYGDDFEDKTTIPSAGCFSHLFFGCTSLTTSPELPATTLTDGCYAGMFSGCTSLTTAHELPATTMAGGCYRHMFEACASLTTAPELPATTLADYCYQKMFKDCTSLTTAPSILPATTFETYCCDSMFQNCTSLTTAPELPSAKLISYCYQYMFSGCTGLSHITMLAGYIGDYSSLYNWVKGVSSTGTFIKHPDMDSLPTGDSGIPEGWAVEDAVL